MKKINKFGRVLSKKEQKDIKGGASVNCPGGVLSIGCPSGYNGVNNTVNPVNSAKCCHQTIDCCVTIRCDGTSVATGAGCDNLPPTAFPISFIPYHKLV
jgi:hypothetical protein